MTSQILVVDDDPVQRRLLTNMIERLGAMVANVRSGSESTGAAIGAAAICVGAA